MNGEHSDRRRLIGARLRRLRQESGMTQSALADGTVSRNMLSMIESGTATPSVDTLADFADKLGVSLAYFFADENEERLYKKEQLTDDIYFLYSNKRYEEAARLCDSVGDDFETNFISVRCRMELGAGYLREYRLTSANECFAAAAAISRMSPVHDDAVALTCEYIEKLTGAVSADTLPDTLFDGARFARSMIPAEFFAYMYALKAIADKNTSAAGALAGTDIMGSFHSLHIRGTILMNAENYADAVRLFDLALTSADGGGFFSKYRLLCDLEKCHKLTGDFKSAYAASTGRMEMLGLFSK